MLTRLRDLNVAAKLFAGFGVVCLMLAAVVGLGINRLGFSQASLETVSNEGVASVQTIGSVKEIFSGGRIDLLKAGLAPDEAGTQDALADMQESDEAYDEAWQAYLASSPAAPAAQRAEVEDLMAQYRTVREKLIPLAVANDTAGFYNERKASSGPVVDELNAALDGISAAERDAAADTAAAGSSAYHTAVVLLLVIGALAIAIAIAVAVAVARSIAQPLAKTLTVVQGLAHGRLDQRVHHSARDEVGQLAAAVDTTMDNLTGTMRRIAGASTTLAASSEELSAVA
ncbi:MCP four helix bundle domain-containing protein, partial [Kineococcus sp. SYSU DK005]|uniref:MCP four helix bundle domain-containing protein n=1 Tax=Kineococcus sp. SYSU DK005 TaxID=3383126 RepID=UPI003D7EA5A6